MRKILGPIDVNFINQTFFSDYLDIAVINEGECFRWAYIAFRLFQDAELWDMPYHAFVRSKTSKRFFDSERPKGVSRWRNLPAARTCRCSNRRCICINIYSDADLSKFQYEWGGPAQRWDVNWFSLDQEINKILMEKCSNVAA